MIEVKLYYLVYVYCYWYRILYKNWFFLYNVRLLFLFGKFKFLCVVVFFIIR